MAIINVTPDSFSGDGCASLGAAMRAAESLISEGAEILDIGGESSRPGAQTVGVQEEIDRVVPVVEALAQFGVPLSVDTVKPAVMRESIKVGADIINDIAAFRADGAVDVVKNSAAALCVMHMKGVPETMQLSPRYTSVLAEVESFLVDRLQSLIGAGISADRILVDPGFGFGKTVEHNFSLLKGLRQLDVLGYPVLVGMSRKSMLGSVTGRDVADRVVAGALAAMLAIQNGARIVRTHDVAATRDAVRIWLALEAADGEASPE
ncbi:dihydropteroate synthase [Zoogloea sp.]|uniref:dihydropteroate synthase n=1 Tax=Zoogloea sp. TaxID=49181 RepID=UPI00345C323A